MWYDVSLERRTEVCFSTLHRSTIEAADRSKMVPLSTLMVERISEMNTDKNLLSAQIELGHWNFVCSLITYTWRFKQIDQINMPGCDI